MVARVLSSRIHGGLRTALSSPTANGWEDYAGEYPVLDLSASSRVGSNHAPAIPFSRRSIATTIAAARSCGHDLNPRRPEFDRSSLFPWVGSAIHDAHIRQKNATLQSIEDVREAAAQVDGRMSSDSDYRYRSAPCCRRIDAISAC